VGAGEVSMEQTEDGEEKLKAESRKRIESIKTKEDRGWRNL
jgi:hypothetical protein